jgi:urea transport system permease protein
LGDLGLRYVQHRNQNLRSDEIKLLTGATQKGGPLWPSHILFFGRFFMRRFLVLCFALLALNCAAFAQEALGPLQTVLQANRAAIEKASRTTVETVISALLESRNPSAAEFLENWRDKGVAQRKTDGLIVFAKEDAGGLALTDIDTGQSLGAGLKTDFEVLRPNSGVRAVLSAALVQFQLSDPDPAKRTNALVAIERDANETHLLPLRASIEGETDPILKARKSRLERLLSMAFETNKAARITAIQSFASDTSVDVRAALNPLVTTKPGFAKQIIDGTNIARMITIGSGLSVDEAYGLLAAAGEVAPAPATADITAALIANKQDDQIAGVPVASLNTEAARETAYAALAQTGKVPPLISEDQKRDAVSAYQFYDAYVEPDADITNAAKGALSAIRLRLGFYQAVDLALDAVSLASIYFLAAIGLAITFGVMRVINMAHGEFIMIGAYTGYVVQQYIADYTLSIIVALPLAFLVAALAGVALERLVIRHLAGRPLETLLATFGISIALQQLAKNIFGTQARPLTSPDWLGGAFVANDIIAISYIRIAIFVLALIFLALLLFILSRTRLGLEVRAVTQNPKMAASMGINTDRINMMTFALGSGIAGIAGVAIGLFAKVTSELGSAYIVQSFMTVVVGGVGNIWGTLAGASMIGGFQKLIEFFNPSNTLAAQTYMIIFIIIFIQFRPKGIIALKGRAAGD